MPYSDIHPIKITSPNSGTSLSKANAKINIITQVKNPIIDNILLELNPPLFL